MTEYYDVIENIFYTKLISTGHYHNDYKYKLIMVITSSSSNP